jgi:RHS repeat-associated protein
MNLHQSNFRRGLGIFLITLVTQLTTHALTLSWANSLFSDPAQQKVPSGQTYVPVVQAVGGSGNVTITITKADGTYVCTGTNTAGSPTSDTGNKYVSFSATGRDNSTGATASLGPVSIKIYIADTTAPSIPTALSYANLQPTQFNLLWTGSTDNQLVDSYQIAIGGTVVGSTPAGTTHYLVTGLSAGGTYSMTVRACDWAGNYSAWSSALSVTTPIPDTTAPTQPGTLTATTLAQDHFTLSWAASTDNKGVTGYEVVLRLGSSTGSVVSTQTTTSTSFAFTGLNPGVGYFVSVTALDAAGNRSTAQTTTVVTPNPPYSSTPGQPLGLTASNIKATSLTVSWNPAVDGHAIDHYIVSLNGTATTLGKDANGSAVMVQSYTGLTANTTYAIAVQAVDSAGVASAWSTISVSTNSQDLVTLADEAIDPTPIATGTTLVAAAPADLSVDNHGSANYSIPLQIAPGRRGFQPQLTLAYNSASGNGPVGVGWSLATGFPQSITRGRSLLARDGTVRGVCFDDTNADPTKRDRFYLDGKLLICVGGSYGSANSTYRTEVDSFVTIATSGAGNTIDTFVLTDKSGRKFTFGKYNSTVDGFQKGGGESGEIAYSYALKRVEDSLGNYINFTYLNLGGGEYVLDHIDYTGGPSGAPLSKVQLTYSSRQDQPRTYLAGRTFEHRARLRLVTSIGPGSSSTTPNACYTLAYEYGRAFDGSDLNTPYAASVGRSRLLSVTPLLLDPTNKLCPCKPTVISWQNHVNQLCATPTSTYPSQNYNAYEESMVWGDFDGNGKDAWRLSDTRSERGMVGDFNGDGIKEAVFFGNPLGASYTDLSFSVLVRVNGSLVSFSPDHNAFCQLFRDPGSNTSLLLQSEGPAVSSRVTIADFDGDGRDDLLVHSFDGYLYLFHNNGSGFDQPVKSTYYVGGAGEVVMNDAQFLANEQISLYVHEHYFVRPIPCDLNGDGRMDYVFVETQRFWGGTEWVGPDGNVLSRIINNYTNIRTLKGVLSLPAGGFSAPFCINQFEPFNSYSQQPLAFKDVYCGVLPGDFNGDGLTDFLVLDNKGMMGKRWLMLLCKGNTGSSYDTPAFDMVLGPMEETTTVNGEEVRTFFKPCTNDWWGKGVVLPDAFGSLDSTVFAAMESGGATTNAFIMDVNHDGLADYVWYVGVNAADGATTNAGWYAMLSTGKFTSATSSSTNGSGFVGPIRLHFLDAIDGGATLGSRQVNGFAKFISTKIVTDIDVDGDGHADYCINTDQTNGVAETPALVYTAGPAALQFNDTVQQVTDGLGRTTQVVYRAAKDSSIYTRGADVSYPIRQLWASTPVVSDVIKDSGSNNPSDFAHFSYQYSGNRLDVSGRGSLGFHSFITLDNQTNLFKYQFLTQSFPMTGLAQREQTYRFTGSDASKANFRLISSHDNTVVFDEVVDGGGSGLVFGTLYPFISKAVESRWEDTSAANVSVALGNTSSDPENLFTASKPGGAYITITATSLFDNQAAVQDSIPQPGLTGTASAAAPVYNASDTSSLGINTVSGSVDYTSFSALSFPRKITYGNLVQLTTDYGSGFTETVTNDYSGGGVASMGLPGKVTTTVTSTNHGNQTAPVKSYTYCTNGSVQTPLVASEKTDTSVATDYGTNLTTTTNYGYDSRWRQNSTTITGTDLQFFGQGSVLPYTVSSVPSDGFDDTFDLPKTILDAYSHTTAKVYDAVLGLPTSVTGPNQDQVTTTYDALGRVTKTVDVLSGVETDSSYSWDSTVSVGGPSGCNGVDTGAPITGVTGLTLASAYSVTTLVHPVSTTSINLQPSVTAYYDRLGRVIRSIKTGFNSQKVQTDIAYNNLGQGIATSLPYLSNGSPLWTKTTYDPLGRVVTVTAPNGTITTSTYNGRAAAVSVDAPDLGGVDPAPQVNTTVVDAKGRTIGVWNADNVPTFSDTLGSTTTAPSIAFDLDGFGRMRTTTLKGQTQTITATYDALGHQTQLADPDKGTWNYVNSALGLVLKQTDAKTNVTKTTYDLLNRPIVRTTSEASSGPVETANWYYYDSVTNGHRVSFADKGWIGALQRDESVTTGAPGYTGTNSATTTVHYYDSKGQPSIDLATIDGKYFYTYSDYDAYNRLSHIRHYWRSAGHESATDDPYLWQDFGYTYTYDTNSYLTSLTDSLGRSWWDTPSYDYMDRVTSVRKGSGYTTTRVYRPEDGVLTGITTSFGASSIQNLGFKYDGLGNLTQRTGSGGTEPLTYDNLNRLKTSNQGTMVYADNGNITSKPEVGNQTVSLTNYDSVRPHAVSRYTFNGQTIDIAYDANGNLLSRTGGGSTWSMKWAGFDKPRWMAKTTGSTVVGSEFLYNANRSRTVQMEFDALSGNAPSHYVRKRIYALGSTLEINYRNKALAGSTDNWSLDTVRIYVPGPDGVIGAREFTPGSAADGSEKPLVYHYDHLGSIESITPFASTGGYANDNGGKPGQFSEDAWGQRRNPLTWSGPPTTTDDGGADSLTPRGFTGHEMLDDLGLVHMNGRIYDPLLGRMLSSDVLVQDPGSLQSFNRYSYVANNPLSLTDPSGFEALKITNSTSVNVGGFLSDHTVRVTSSVGSESGTQWTGVTVTSHSHFGAEPQVWTGSFSGESRNLDAAAFISQTPAMNKDAAAAILVAFTAGELAKIGSDKPVEQSKPKEDSSDGKIDPKQKDGVKPYESGTYGGLKDKEKKGDGLDIDHQPSNASNVAREEQALGRPLTPEEAAQVKNDGPAVAVPVDKHRSDSPTYGGRNTPAQIQQDAANPVDAAKRDGQAMVDAAAEAQKEAARKAAEENLERVRKLHQN